MKLSKTVTPTSNGVITTIVKGSALSFDTLAQWSELTIKGSSTRIKDISLDDLVALKKVDIVLFVKDGEDVRLIMLDNPTTQLEGSDLETNFEAVLREQVQKFRQDGIGESTSIIPVNSTVEFEIEFLDGIDALSLVDAYPWNFKEVESYVDIFQFGLYKVQTVYGGVVFDKKDFDEDFKTFKETFEEMNDDVKQECVDAVKEFNFEIIDRDLENDGTAETEDTDKIFEKIKESVNWDKMSEKVSPTINQTLEQVLSELEGGKSTLDEVIEKSKTSFNNLYGDEALETIEKKTQELLKVLDTNMQKGSGTVKGLFDLINSMSKK